MKKTLLKVVSIMMLLAMVVTAVVIPNASAKAADKETEIVLVLSAETDATVLLDFDNGQNTANLAPQGTEDTTSLSWGRTMYQFTKDSSNPLVYRMKVKGSVADGTWANIQFVLAKGGNGQGFKYYPQDDKATWNDNSTLYFQIDLTNTGWPTVTPTTKDPLAATAADVMEIIDAIGTVTLSDDCKAKIEAARAAYGTYSGDASDITNYAKLTAAESEWNRLLAAGAGKLTLHVKTSWTKVYLYGWDGADLGSWSGTAMTADANNDGWYTITTTLTQAASLIVNNGSGSQTKDWKYVSADEYWVTITGDRQDVTASTTAPTGWSTGSSQTPGESETPSESESQTPSESESQTPSESESQTPSESESEEVKNDYVPVYSAATIAGDFSALANANITTSWDVANTAANMTHLGNGIYVYELTFDAPSEEVTVNYKVAFNNAWDVAIGYDYTNKAFTTAGGSDNLYITIPAGTTSVKIYADENGLVAYNTIQNPDEAADLLAIAKKGDMNMVAVYMVLFAGAALVAVGVASKKKVA